ncbi:MAG: DUF2339 domain-containing protein [Gemmatimonadaceae bacterium]|nr:DUF2339 domain-containing protein [Gemmatimonadaceae bacterium]
MQPDDELTLDARVARLERGLAAVSASLDAILSNNTAPADPIRPGPRARPQFAQLPIQGKSAEWWLARGGALLTCLALIMLYQYAVDRNWITPVVRLAAGTAVGAGLMIAAARIARTVKPAPDDTVGLREVLMGAALSAWYITAYAGAVFYHLVPVSGARAIFFALSIAGAWLALREKRALLAILAIGVGFAAPALLPSATPSIPAFAAYILALTAVGLVLYLMRGWQSVLWLTFIAFWWNAGEAVAITCCSSPLIPTRMAGSPVTARIAMTLLVALCTAMLVRVPILRRRLLALGSDLYTEPLLSEWSHSILVEVSSVIRRVTGQPTSLDSAALWAITLSSPLLALFDLSTIWRFAPVVTWGAAAAVIAVIAFRLASSARAPDDEFTHVEAAAAALWSLAGIIWLADPVSTALHVSVFPTILIGAAAHAFVALYFLRGSRFRVPRGLAKITAVGAVTMTVFAEITTVGAGFKPWWTSSAIVTIATSAWIWWTSRRIPEERGYATVIGIVAYLALMLVDGRLLGHILRPLVTASYALAGTAMLVASMRTSNPAVLRRLGGFTLVVVVARLFMLDLAGVETIWRVLLFLVCGALFLLTSYLLQVGRKPSVTG